MAGPLAFKDVISACLKGVQEAQKTYETWSEEWLWRAPEYFTTVFIARELGKLRSPKCITLENGAKSALEDAGAGGRGRLHSNIRANGRFDILLWWSDGTPRAPIEVKCQVLYLREIESDIRRIEKVIHRKKSDSTISFGVIVFYSSCRDSRGRLAKDRLSEYLEKISDGAKKLVGNSCQVSMQQSKIHVVDGDAWAAAALIFRAKSS